jgi:hypothetical protein
VLNGAKVGVDAGALLACRGYSMLEGQLTRLKIHDRKRPKRVTGQGNRLLPITRSVHETGRSRSGGKSQGEGRPRQVSVTGGFARPFLLRTTTHGIAAQLNQREIATPRAAVAGRRGPLLTCWRACSGRTVARLLFA